MSYLLMVRSNCGKMSINHFPHILIINMPLLLNSSFLNFTGVLHTGYDNRETVREEYEVLCEDRPCTLKYLVAKKIRDRLKKVEMIHRKKYSTRVQNALSNIERLLAPICRKVSKMNNIVEVIYYILSVKIV